jgi:hypothetical protein
MAVSFNRLTKRASGSRYIIAGDLTLDNSYPTGGYAVTPALFGHRNSVTSIDTTVTAGGYTLLFVPSTSKVKAFRVGAINSPLAEVPNATDLSAEVARLHVTGK